MTLHPAFSGFQDAEALILVHRAGHDRRLLSDYSFPNDLGVHTVANGVVNEPAAGEKLGRHRADILDTNKVGEDIMALRRLRVIAEIDRSHGDAHPFRLAVEEASGGHTMKLVVRSERALFCTMTATRWLSRRRLRSE